MNWDSEKIKELRRRLGWSFSDLARRMETPSQTVLGLENGDLLPSPEQIQVFDILQKQAEGAAQDTICASLADLYFEQNENGQITTQDLDRKF
jgi:DNA-binding XRE family transcriptional regulator